ncbi:MAG: hypothetical protein EA400_15385 [Chromatiaceae bacterium]|nr:MAG: hypothetical protein EA400_15385 [Chromatiaceae bacterium]
MFSIGRDPDHGYISGLCAWPQEGAAPATVCKTLPLTDPGDRIAGDPPPPTRTGRGTASFIMML